MSIQNIKQSRRAFLKGATYTSLLSLGGVSSLAFATKASKKSLGSAINNGINNGIKIIQETKFDKEVVTLVNQSGKLQMIDARQPISLFNKGGRLVVSVNQNDEDAVNGMVLMSPNEHFTFEVKAIGIEMDSKITHLSEIPVITNIAENKLHISSDNSVFNRIVPVQVV